MEAIVEDLAAMDINPKTITYTSDYFPQMLDLASRLIMAGHLYADDTPVEQMRQVSNVLFEVDSWYWYYY